MKILLIAVHFHPDNSVAAMRPVSWTRYLATQGHDVSVLTAARKCESASVELVDYERLEVAAPGARLFRAASTFEVHATRDTKTARWSLRAWLRDSLYALRRKRGIFSSARMPDHYDLWILPALRRTRGRHWDVVISTHGPYACHAVACVLRRSGRANRWVADFRDLWTDNHIFPGLAPFTFVERRLESFLLSRADAVTTVSDGLAHRLQDRHARTVSVISNGVDLDDLVTLDPAPAFPRDGLVRVVYTGTIYPTGQDPEPLFAAMRRLGTEAPDFAARLRLVFVGKFQARLAELVSHYCCAGSVELMGQVSRSVALRMQRDADSLLFLPFIAPGHDGILTGKLFEYLASGTWILSVGRARDESTARLIEQSRRGRDYAGNVTEICAALRHIVQAGSTGKFTDLETVRRIDRRASNARLLEIIEGHLPCATREQPVAHLPDRDTGASAG